MILVFGATGYTGRMVVDALVDRGLPVRIAGRSPERLEKLALRHGGLDWAVADVEDPPTVASAAQGVDVMVTTVGPYGWWGRVAADVAIEQRIPYIDISGEPGWLREVFLNYGPRAAKAKIALLPAIGYDYVPGNLAGAIALEAAGDTATRIDIGYFVSGKASRSLSSFSAGTLRSLKASSSESASIFRDGKLVDERAAKKVLEFDLGQRVATAIAIGSSEHFSLPAVHPALREVNVGLGWFGPATRAVGALAAATEKAESVPGVRDLIKKATGANKAGTTKGRDAPTGPSDQARAQARTVVVAVARDGDGNELAGVRLEGPGPYDLTGALVSRVAELAADGDIDGVGALGPVQAFGLSALRDLCAESGLVETRSASEA